LPHFFSQLADQHQNPELVPNLPTRFRLIHADMRLKADFEQRRSLLTSLLSPNSAPFSHKPGAENAAPTVMDLNIAAVLMHTSNAEGIRYKNPRSELKIIQEEENRRNNIRYL